MSKAKLGRQTETEQPVGVSEFSSMRADGVPLDRSFGVGEGKREFSSQSCECATISKNSKLLQLALHHKGLSVKEDIHSLG
uniref:Uncharacterized protein n=1 Tax=Anguilla anguilla TaxID=7936 RepID=A0A0E9XM46_ANGAN